jgi:hypothetical protein
MYKVNEKTKIGRKIKELIESGIFKESFHKADISFLTTPNEDRSDLNIHIYPENRLEHLKNNLGEIDENNLHIPGCITCCIYEEISLGYNFPKDKNLDIKVIFGSKAASSRKPKGVKEIYEINSHNQLPELEYLTSAHIRLEHSLDMEKEKTTISINSDTFEACTVECTAKVAIEYAINLIYKKIKDEK